ncbi:DUF4340 domain-containing protein [Treponema primitia]|uniref:DUF4340 domain-containing protein n=1 Tax=Treponema primitia TaxID=88058 RepID=UPI00025556C8|nr:DUF4340 domain-containing protein [Treponema primitia]
MVYKKKLILLSGLVGLLALVYLLTLFFDPERVNTRNAAFLWLDAKLQDRVDGIEIAKAGEWSNPVKLIRRGNDWYALIGEGEFPAKAARVEDLLRTLTLRGAYPVRGSAASSHERLGLTENNAARILLKGGAGLSLLDLLIGGRDAAGQEIYLRKNDQNEVRSGEDKFSAYVGSAETSWYNLRLFDPQLSTDTALVQRLTVLALPPEDGGERGEPLVITRNGSGWSIEGLDDESIDSQRVDTYVRGILDAEGENFVPGLTAASTSLSDGRIVLELGNGTSLTINVGTLPEGKKGATASGSSYVYILADWTITRLFRDRSYFSK